MLLNLQELLVEKFINLRKEKNLLWYLKRRMMVGVTGFSFWFVLGLFCHFNSVYRFYKHFDLLQNLNSLLFPIFFLESVKYAWNRSWYGIGRVTWFYWYSKRYRIMFYCQLFGKTLALFALMFELGNHLELLYAMLTICNLP